MNVVDLKIYVLRYISY